MIVTDLETVVWLEPEGLVNLEVEANGGHAFF